MLVSAPKRRHWHKACQRLQKAWAIPTRQTTPDLYIKVFDDLDQLLFGGMLCNRVRTAWTDNLSLASDVYGITKLGSAEPRVMNTNSPPHVSKGAQVDGLGCTRA